MDFSGMVGAILGSVSTLVVSKWLQSWGRITCIPVKWVISWQKQNSYGEFTPCSKEETTYIHYELEGDFFNAKDSPIGLRNFRLVFLNGKDELMSDIPYDERTRRHTIHGLSLASELDVVNLPPHEFIHLKITGGIMEADKIELISKAKSVFLNALNHKGKPLMVKVCNLCG